MRRLAVLLFAVAAVAACTATRTQPEFAWDKTASFAYVKTFAWYDGPPFEYPHGGSIADGRFIDEHVRKAVEAALERKGFQRVAEGSSDIHVTYHTSATGLVDHDVWGRYGWWSPYVHVASTYQKTGALALDFRDGDKKLLWRGVVSGVVGSNLEEVTETIESAVADLLENFPPRP